MFKTVDLWGYTYLASFFFPLLISSYCTVRPVLRVNELTQAAT